MSDDLRTRIASVLLPDLEYAAAYNPTSESPEDWAASLADAVIRELGLREERTASESITNEQGATWHRKTGRRYVTEWSNK